MMTYDMPIEVTRSQYAALMTRFCGVIAGREDAGRYYVKVWLMGYAGRVQQVIDTIK